MQLERMLLPRGTGPLPNGKIRPACLSTWLGMAMVMDVHRHLANKLSPSFAINAEYHLGYHTGLQLAGDVAILPGASASLHGSEL